jgi:hypothetical protein
VVRFNARWFREDEPEAAFTVKEVLDDIVLARAEAARLNKLNGPKGAHYSVQVTRLLRQPLDRGER